MYQAKLSLLIIIVFSEHSFAGWFDKKIRVSKCYDVKEYSSYKDLLKKRVTGNPWTAEIDLKENTVVVTVPTTSRVLMSKAGINVKTERFVRTYPDDPFGFIRLFDLENNTVTTAKEGRKEQSIMKCKFK